MSHPALSLRSLASAAALAALLPLLELAAQDAAAGVPALTDAEIAAIVVTANTGDIENGKLALERASSAEVKAFAKTMVTDHTAVNQQAAALVAKLGVTPAPSDASRDLASATDAQRQELAKKEGAAFDRAYVENEIAYHQSVLETLDAALIPSAENAELESLLIAVRPAFVAHLEHAKHLQTSLEG